MSQQTDYILMTDHPPRPSGHPAPIETHYTTELDLGGDLRIGPIGELAEAIKEACEQRGEGWTPPINLTHVPYAFYRVDAPGTGQLWDPDHSLATCVALSRLVRPTSIGRYYSARVIEGTAGRRTISPSLERGFGALAFVVEETENWLRDADISELKDLLAAFAPQALPERVLRAMWCNEFAAWTHEIDVSWTLIATALEALIHTNDKGHKPRLGSTAQFTTRVASMRQRIDGVTIPKSDLESMYDLRSSLAHGMGLGGFGSVERTLYLLMHQTLRLAVSNAIREPTFADVFVSDATIRAGL